MKKIVLIYPNFSPGAAGYTIPAGLLHLGTFLKSKGFDIKLIDCIVESNYKDLIAQEIKDAFCVGISALTLQIPIAREIAIFIKNKLKSNIPIVLGGVHPTLYPRQTILEPFLDFVVLGEGELAFFHLVEAIYKDELYSRLPEMSGVAYLDRNRIPHVNSNKEVFNYEEMPVFDYSLLNPRVIEIYRKEDIQFPLLTSRGCPFKCAFCITTITENTKYRSLKAARIVFEIERIIKMGFGKILFTEDSFFISRKKVFELLELLEKKNLVFQGRICGRVDDIRADYVDIELLKRLRKNGFSRIGFGFESGSQRILDYLQKNTTVSQILNAVKQCSSAGIEVSGTFMIGIPTETAEDIRKTVDIIGKISMILNSEKLVIKGPILYRPYPGSKLYLDCLKTGWAEPQNFSEWCDWLGTRENPYKKPWIKNPQLVSTVSFYTYIIPMSFRNLFITLRYRYLAIPKHRICFFYIWTAAFFLLSVLGKLRYKLNFHSFLIEKNIWHLNIKFLRNIYVYE